jgi:DNA-binding response OmpR family regulator
MTLRILVLDDDELVRRSLERHASRRSDVVLEVVGTMDELRARLASSEPYDLIACDHRLKIDGRSVTSDALVRELAAEGLPVVVFTADIEAVPPPGVGLLPKPFGVDELVAEARARRDQG